MTEIYWEGLLKEHGKKLKGLLSAYIGDRNRGTIIAHFNPAHLNKEALALHSSEMLRSLTRLHGITANGYAEPDYFVSNSLGERVMIQSIGNSSWYLAFVTSAKSDYRKNVGVFKQLLEACQLTPQV